MSSLKVLFVSNLFPDANQPYRGLDNATLLAHLRARGVAVRVLSPRPGLLPWRANRLRPRAEDEALAPHYLWAPYVPRVGSRANHRLMRAALASAFRKIVESWQPDVILGSWLYPDGWAISKLSHRHGVPCVLITQGTDTHHYLEIPPRRRAILEAINGSKMVIARSGDLARRLEEAGAPPDKLTTIYNGVDTGRFQPREKSSACQALHVSGDGPLLLYVGNFVPVKNPVFLLEALAKLRARGGRFAETQLAMIGQGPLHDEIAGRAEDLGLSAALHLTGPQSPDQVALWMNAADVLCLTSRLEGFPNVILEAMASCLPVVSTDVGGISERLNAPSLGRLVSPGDIERYVAALTEQLNQPPSSPAVSPSVTDKESLSWAQTAGRYLTVLTEAMR